MKKVSIAAAEPSRNFSQQKLTIGLDLGDRSSWYCVLDEAGKIQREQRVSTTAKILGEVFGRMPHPVSVGTCVASGLPGNNLTLGAMAGNRGAKAGELMLRAC